MKFAYVLSPYTSKSETEMNLRAHMTACGIAQLMEKFDFNDYIFFSPVVHYHQVAMRSITLPRDVGYWWNINLTFMRQATHAVVFQMPGWEESVGIKKELDWFKNCIHPSPEIIFYNTHWENF
jgi:hypothetical protein